MGFLDQAREQKNKLNTALQEKERSQQENAARRAQETRQAQPSSEQQVRRPQQTQQNYRQPQQQTRSPQSEQTQRPSNAERTRTVESESRNDTSPERRIDKNSNYQKQDQDLIPHLTTFFDRIIKYLVKADAAVYIKTIAIDLGINRKTLEKYIEILEQEKAVKLEYPFNLFSDIKVKLNKLPKQRKKYILPSEKELVESYTLTADNVTAEIRIWNAAGEEVKIYEILNPELGVGTRIFSSHIINKLSKEITINTKDIRDEKKHEKVKNNFLKKTRDIILGEIPDIDNSVIETLSGIILHEIYGLGELELIMADNWLEEVAINGSKFPLSVYHKRFGWVKTTKYIKNDEEIYNFASQIGRKVGRQINSLNPLMDAHLITGDRVAATLFPISTAGHTITIRRFSRNPWTVIHMIDPKVNTMSAEVAAFLWLCIQYELNILVAGGTASGKTSVLNSIAALIPDTQRILSIEDTRELTLPTDLQWNWVPLSSRKPNPEGHGGVSMLDLMVESLRMRPDRIIVGEVRRREQAETLFETMHTGHSVYATIHADTVEQVERRLLEPPIEIPKTEIGALQLIIVQYRDRRKGSRRTLEVAEILSQETDDKSLSLNYLFRWKAREDKFEKINNSIRVMEDLNLHTGLTEVEIKEDLKTKEEILLWLLKHNVKDVDMLGAVTKLYYKSKEKVIRAMRNDLDPKDIIHLDSMNN